MFLDVRFDGEKILIDEGRDFIVGVGFGLQPNAPASGRGGAEINQQRLLRGLCLGEGGINIFLPINSHLLNLFET